MTQAEHILVFSKMIARFSDHAFSAVKEVKLGRIPAHQFSKAENARSTRLDRSAKQSFTPKAAKVRFEPKPEAVLR